MILHQSGNYIYLRNVLFNPVFKNIQTEQKNFSIQDNTTSNKHVQIEETSLYVLYTVNVEIFVLG